MRLTKKTPTPLLELLRERARLGSAVTVVEALAVCGKPAPPASVVGAWIRRAGFECVIGPRQANGKRERRYLPLRRPVAPKEAPCAAT